MKTKRNNFRILQRALAYELVTLESELERSSQDAKEFWKAAIAEVKLQRAKARMRADAWDKRSAVLGIQS